MRRLMYLLVSCTILLIGKTSVAQDLHFNQVLKGKVNNIQNVQQDRHGVLWIASFDNKIQRYDGVNLKTYVNDPNNPLSIAAAPFLRLTVDANNIVWIATVGKGLERLDPATNSFTHFRHNPQDATSLSNDTVIAIKEDRSGNLWVGTLYGLDLLDRKTGKFSHYKTNAANPASLSHKGVFNIVEDRKGVLWLYAGLFDAKKPGIVGGALNRFDKSTGKFVHFYQDSTKPINHIPGKFINDIYEDKKENFWISTDAGLFLMDRNKGSFTRYYPDPFHSGYLGTAPINQNIRPGVSFVKEDASGAFWVAMAGAGVNRYDPISKKSTHFGAILDEKNKQVSNSDTAKGIDAAYIQGALNSMDGLLWMYIGNRLYQLNSNKVVLPFYNLTQNLDGYAFYQKPGSNLLWIGTDAGLIRKDLQTKKEKKWLNDPKNTNSLSLNIIQSVEGDQQGNIWVGTASGIDKFDPIRERFTHYKNIPGDTSSINTNAVLNLFFDHHNYLWASTDSGISKMNTGTGKFTNYHLGRSDNALNKPTFFASVVEDRENLIWTSCNKGVFRVEPETGKYKQYLSNSFIKSLCVDTKGIIWAGGIDGLYRYNKAKDVFELFANESSAVSMSNIFNILEDNQMNLWVSSSSDIIKINADRIRIKKYSDVHGVRPTGYWYNDNLKAADGQLFLGIEDGYYAFYPNKISDTTIAPVLTITGFKLGDKEIDAAKGDILKAPLWQTDEIRLPYNQNVFSFDFVAVDYVNNGEKKYLFMLENYDNSWHDLGSDHRASFYNIPPGKYIFRVKAVSVDGGFAEKSIRILISPPWYKTWWAYILYILLFIISGYLIFLYQKNYILKRERARTREKEFLQAKEIEKAYHELKQTQSQLIQSEKMASLGELTAGIAHEIQNPLNFVNNFSEVSRELIDELKQERSKEEGIRDKGLEEELLSDIDANLEKINHHGQRAAAIVKGMLQHSRTSSGQKEPTDINALCDEYLRLAYHGLRAKDKSFNAEFTTEFDESIPKVNIVPQDMGRVVLNLINNAFFAVSERSKVEGISHKEEDVTHTPSSLPLTPYTPTVTVSTRKTGNTIIISVSDNGTGIPDDIKEKIFQPFFTTKPTGQGTGLGLSLAYDIVTKVHGGKLSVDSEQGKGTTFKIEVPI